MLNLGAMRHVIRIEQRSTTQDAAGEPLNTWTLYAERRAALDRLPGREVWASAQRSGRIPVVFRIHYTDGVLPSMRVVFNSRVFDILSVVDVDGHNESMALVTEEHVESTA